MEKHSDAKNINDFIETFAQYYNEKVVPNTYIILNDVNLGRGYGGGRDYFDQLRNKLCSSISDTCASAQMIIKKVVKK